MPDSVIQRKVYELPPVDTREVLRYARAGQEVDENTLSVLGEVLAEAAGVTVAGRVCFRECAIRVAPPEIHFGEWLRVASRDLCVNLQGCHRGVLFAATIGMGIDRVIAKYSRLSPVKALFAQALGAERIEALCDLFCNDIQTTRPRFSPGYGDLPLELQRPIFELLEAPRQIGLTLNESLLMSPSKSVTAIAGK